MSSGLQSPDSGLEPGGVTPTGSWGFFPRAGYFPRTMHPSTRSLHVRVDTREARPAVTPLYQSSAFHAGSPYFYSRKNNPNVAEVEDVVAGLEGARHAVGVSTGMAALTLALGRVRAGGTVLAHRVAYGCSLRLLERLSCQRGFQLQVIDLTAPGFLDRPAPPADLVMFETPTNPFLATVPIARVAAHVRRTSPEALVVVDNTWATPLFQRPLELGADISVHSATKFLSGHSDVMGGFLLTDREDLHQEILQDRFYLGPILDPHSAWLLRRSLQTLSLRMERHVKTTRTLLPFLRSLPQVETVYEPETGGQLRDYGGIVFIQLRCDLADYYDAIVERLALFDTGTGMACVTSMIARPYFGSHASLSGPEKAEMGIDPGLVRLCFGLEDPGDLADDLATALQAVDPQQLHPDPPSPRTSVERFSP